MLNMCLTVDMTLCMAVGVEVVVGVMLGMYFVMGVGVSCWSER